MNKKALFNFISDGVTYEKGKIYSADAVAHLDQTNFEDTDGAPNATVENQEEVATNEVASTTTSDEDGVGEKKEGVVVSHNSDDNKGAGLDDHKVITQEDLDTNPDYVALGLQVGDPIPADENVLE